MKIIETIILTEDDIEQLKKRGVIYSDGEHIKGTVEIEIVKE